MYFSEGSFNYFYNNHYFGKNILRGKDEKLFSVWKIQLY